MKIFPAFMNNHPQHLAKALQHSSGSTMPISVSLEWQVPRSEATTQAVIWNSESGLTPPFKALSEIKTRTKRAISIIAIWA
jgi:hypothetical protein